jgi:hypothetical protein
MTPRITDYQMPALVLCSPRIHHSVVLHSKQRTVFINY